MITWTNIYLALCAAPVAHLSPVRPSRSVAVGRPLPPRRSSPGLSLVYGHDLPGCGGGERGMVKHLLPQRQLSDEHGGTLWVTHFGAGACAFLPPGFPVWVARPRYCLVFFFFFVWFVFVFVLVCASSAASAAVVSTAASFSCIPTGSLGVPERGISCSPRDSGLAHSVPVPGPPWPADAASQPRPWCRYLVAESCGGWVVWPPRRVRPWAMRGPATGAEGSDELADPPRAAGVWLTAASAASASSPSVSSSSAAAWSLRGRFRPLLAGCGCSLPPGLWLWFPTGLTALLAVAPGGSAAGPAPPGPPCWLPRGGATAGADFGKAPGGADPRVGRLFGKAPGSCLARAPGGWPAGTAPGPSRRTRASRADLCRWPVVIHARLLAGAPRSSPVLSSIPSGGGSTFPRTARATAQG